VVDSNPAALESVQFPTFIGIPSGSAPATAQETVQLAPVSTLFAASQTAPVPRFAALMPVSDCSILGDCGAAYFPKLSVDPVTPIALQAYASGGKQVTANPYITIHNTAGGEMNWTATFTYLSGGSGWLFTDYSSGTNSGSVRVWANTKNLAPGTYNANLVISGGPQAGSVTIPITLTALTPLPVTPTPTPTQTPTPAPTTPTVTVSSVVNAATFVPTPLVAGSLGTVLGSNLAGKVVTVTFDGVPANLVYTSAGQINLQVPAGIAASQTSSTMVVTVDGNSSAPQQVALAPAWPAVFSNGILNQDSSVNAPGAPAKAGDVLQIFTTGIPAGATVSVQIGAQKDLTPLYAGAAPTVAGVQQVNVAIPSGTTTGGSLLVICATGAGQQICSNGTTLTLN
jgi:uncharacterized protein (TIGR03437 family)